jgi:hypothetical protein
MKRSIANLAAVVYVLALATGFVTHVFKLDIGLNVPMYFLTFNMFGGWSGYEARMLIIGEGASGKFYELSPGPWGGFQPYSAVARQHYDQEFEYAAHFVKPALRHAAHEPIVRMFVVETEYPKKLNLPDELYESYYNKPKDVHHYSHVRFVLGPDCEVLSAQPVWLQYQHRLALSDNPRVMADAVRHRPYFAENRPQAPGVLASGSFHEPVFMSPATPPAAE